LRGISFDVCNILEQDLLVQHVQWLIKINASDEKNCGKWLHVEIPLLSIHLFLYSMLIHLVRSLKFEFVQFCLIFCEPILFERFCCCL